MDETKYKFLWIAQLIMIVAVCGLYEYLGFSNENLLGFMVLFIIALPVLWAWRNAKTEFVKRCILAVPFALSLVIIAMLVGFGSGYSFCLGFALFMVLLFKTKKWKVHFAITFSVALIVAFLYIYVGYGESAWYKPYIVAMIGIPVAMFYVGYSMAITQRKPLILRSLLVKTAEFSVLPILLLFLVSLSLKLCWRYNLGFPVSFGLSILITCGVLGFCKLFNIKSPAGVALAQRGAKKIKQKDVCDSCGKTIPNNLLFKTNSGQHVCAHCLRDME